MYSSRLNLFLLLISFLPYIMTNYINNKHRYPKSLRSKYQGFDLEISATETKTEGGKCACHCQAPKIVRIEVPKVQVKYIPVVVKSKNGYQIEDPSNGGSAPGESSVESTPSPDVPAELNISFQDQREQRVQQQQEEVIGSRDRQGLLQQHEDKVTKIPHRRLNSLYRRREKSPHHTSYDLSVDPGVYDTAATKHSTKKRG